nr:hypothetical protein [Tanacetum cinerariifolium]
MKIATKRSRTQFHVSHPSGSGTHKGTGIKPRVLDAPKYGFDDEQISWKSNTADDNDVDEDTADDNDDDQDDDDQEDDVEDDDDEQIESKNDGNNFVHPKFSNHDKEERQNEGDKIKKSFDPRSSYVSSGFISNMLNPNPDTSIDSILNLNTESTSLVDVPINTNVEMPPSSVTTLPLLPIPLIQPQQKTPALTPAIVPKFKQTKLFVEAVSSILGIVDTYLANKMNEAVKTAVQLQSDRLRDKTQAEKEEFIDKLDENIKKIIKKQVKVQVKEQVSKILQRIKKLVNEQLEGKVLTRSSNEENIKKIIKKQVKVQVKEQVSKILPRIKKLVNEQLEGKVLTRSSNEAKTSHAVAANLSELELKKILIDNIESNKSIHRSVQQKTLYKALIDPYETDKGILDTYGDIRRRAGKEPESSSAPKEKTSKSTGKAKEGSNSHQKSNGKSAQASQLPEMFQKPTKPSTPNCDWNKTLSVTHGPIQPWFSNPAQKEDTRDSFNELIDTPLDFLAFVMNRLKVDTLTQVLLADPTFDLMKGSCKSLVELKYFLEEVYKVTIDQLDWNNPEGQHYPHDLRKPLHLIPNSQGQRVIPFDHFINNDLAYLRGSVSIRTYATSATKTKAADYGHIKWIQHLVPNTIWIHVPKNVDKERAGAMIQAIDKQLKNRRIMRSLEKFVGGRLYEGDLRLLERII